jgi:hypothetical protein
MFEHDPAGDVILQREDGDRRFADRKGGRRDDRRKQAFETLARVGQFSRDARVTRLGLGPDMMRDEANDSFAAGWCQALARVRKPIRQPVDPDAAIGIEYAFDDRRVFEPFLDRGSERRA